MEQAAPSFFLTDARTIDSLAGLLLVLMTFFVVISFILPTILSTQTIVFY
ncbi:MAG TPA: hypothetical protein VN711_04685 [Candidatus Saccharimonadales bacterium]|nr:hypothetical protein [Candidatus Saccharimonadales bacterium]